MATQPRYRGSHQFAHRRTVPSLAVPISQRGSAFEKWRIRQPPRNHPKSRTPAWESRLTGNYNIVIYIYNIINEVRHIIHGASFRPFFGCCSFWHATVQCHGVKLWSERLRLANYGDLEQRTHAGRAGGIWSTVDPAWQLHLLNPCSLLNQ